MKLRLQLALLTTYCLGVCVSTQATEAEYPLTRIEWKQWQVESSEDLWAGRKYSNFPLTHLFDGKKETPWVFSGTPRKWKAGGWKSPYAISLDTRSAAGVVMDGLWIMNGHNKRPDLFMRNDRVTQLRITAESATGTTVKTVALSDQMDWHKISLPRQAVRKLSIEFTSRRKGRGPDNDLCIAEVALYNQGHKIDMKMPQAVMFSEGNYGEFSWDILGGGLISRRGKTIAQTAWEEYAHWSPSGRYVLSGFWTWQDENQVLITWVADASTGRVVFRRIFGGKGYGMDSIKWRDVRSIEVTFTGSAGPGKIKRSKRIFKIA